ncbi:MAG: DUF362 domain-containing protein [Actinobacteria bacterium]|nr:DUF362 domain-containing protein [Actinomycetota bacterium]
MDMEREGGWGKRLRACLYPGFSFLCLLWLALRSGRKPSRLRYPCQQAAAVHASWIIAAAGAGMVRWAYKGKGGRRRFIAVPALVLVASLCVAVGGQSGVEAVGREVPDLEEAGMRAASLSPPAWTGELSDGSHDVFAVTNVPVPAAGNPVHAGVDALIRFLDEGGVSFYRSAADYPGAGPEGIISTDDVVLIKVNAAWDQRGMTNTDVVRGLISAVLRHPDGFTGEVVLVENCEGGPDYNQVHNNAEDARQSFQAVVDSFGDPARVSASSWWSFTDEAVYEFDSGDMRQGYVLLGNNVSYPKFVTGRGTCVSLRNGVWTGSGYDKGRVKLINVPVLKSHNATGVTAALKNFMGVPSIHKTVNVHHDLIYQGFMGRMMNEVIFPDLNIIDAIWVSPAHPDGPAGPYSKAVRANVLLAGKDPVALDWYAGKHVLYPISGYGRHDPDTPYGEGTNPYHDGTRNTGYPYNAFRVMLESTASVLRQGGRDVTLDPARMTVRVRDLNVGLRWSGGHCVTGVDSPGTEWHFAEGTTREGFEEWLCLQNPQGHAVRAGIDFMTGEGEVTTHSLELAPHSRSTLHVNHLLGPGKDVSASVRAEVPIVCERPMYFLYNGAWSGGHCVSGVKAPGAEWYFAEGTARGGFDTYICIQNPQQQDAEVRITYMKGDGENSQQGLTVKGESRCTVNVASFLGRGDDVAHDFSARVESTNGVPIVCERPMYFLYNGAWTGGHCVSGVQAPGAEWYFAEGTARGGFDTYICIQNPQQQDAEVRITYMKGDGENSQQGLTVKGESRCTVSVASFLGRGDDVAHDFSARVESTNGVPIVCERPMYFLYNGAWSGGHCVSGVASPGMEWHFAEGTTREGFEEWLCLQNPQGHAVRADLAFMTGEGEVIPCEMELPARSRVTLNVNRVLGPGKDVSVSVRASSPIVCERPMYFELRM